MVVCFMCIFNGTAGILLFAYDWINESQDEVGILKDRVAFKRAKALLEGKDDFKKHKGLKKLKVMLKLSIPVLFIYAVGMFYVMAIFKMFKALDSTAWKLFVTLAAFGLKVCGNKFMLKIVQGARSWVADMLLYSYELVAALLLRILQMSIPDERTAQLVGLIGAVAEVCVRIFFFNLYLKAGVRDKTRMNEDAMHKYAVWGKVRVQDGTNDMLVEYISSAISAMLLIMLAPLDAFGLATTAEISQQTVFVITAYQIVPELFLDFYVTFMEIFCGLSKLYENYWDLRAGGDLRSSIMVDRFGDIGKATVSKLILTIIIMTFVLAAAVK
ncbi:hypothetical protein TL16_g05722 [Triparma laevis f. inornata]|uniref:Uncharacterized protein n=1 Tax=Triparma laevis f. inornata TaxID=1714386 RepID=A0A9W7AKR6_9STRA|nr:hypothetical protein TL16_g05722 [Triparma laevis f. inornata]